MGKHKYTLTINTEENDDWMKALPGYKNEVKLIEQVGKDHAKKEAESKLKPKK